MDEFFDSVLDTGPFEVLEHATIENVVVGTGVGADSGAVVPTEDGGEVDALRIFVAHIGRTLGTILLLCPMLFEQTVLNVLGAILAVTQVMADSFLAVFFPQA